MHSTDGVILSILYTILNNFLRAQNFAQSKLYNNWKIYPSLVQVLHLMEFRDMVDDENRHTFDQPANITWEHALNLFIVK